MDEAHAELTSQKNLIAVEVYIGVLRTHWGPARLYYTSLLRIIITIPSRGSHACTTPVGHHLLSFQLLRGGVRRGQLFHGQKRPRRACCGGIRVENYHFVEWLLLGLSLVI